MRRGLFSILGIIVAVSLATSCTQIPVHFEFGTAENPDGETIYVDSRGFIINGKREIPVAGEMHYQRVPSSEWRNELLKMKAGGVTIVSTYVFWNITEPQEGKMDFSGNNNIRGFIEECGRCGLKVLLRPGPWAHGEWIYGGLPEWLVDKSSSEPENYSLRSISPGFIGATKRYFNALGEETKGLRWKEGGPIIGLQVDNESAGPWEYLRTLKNIAIEAGFDLPFYTRTGCPDVIENGDSAELLLPLGGNYVDGFWCGYEDAPEWFRLSFEFKELAWNADPEDSTLQIKSTSTKWDCPAPGLKYPKLMCELGSGMTPAYHRRINIHDNDIRASVITRLGIGCNMPGYFMYHGGTDPWSPNGTLAECRESKYTNANDLPRRSYDFQAPLGECGKPNLWYHHLRLINQFLHDWGNELSEMDFHQEVASEIRSAIRRNGESGYVFVNNHERMRQMGTNNLNFAGQDIAVPDGESFFFPYGMKFKTLDIDWATVQPFCKTSSSIYFAAVKGIDAKLCIDGNIIAPELDKPYEIDGDTIVIMSPDKSLKAYKVDDKVLFSDGIIYKDEEKIMSETWEKDSDITASAKKIKEENISRVPEMRSGTPLFPKDNELNKAASWSLEIPKDMCSDEWFIAVSYRGDIAQVWVDDVMVEDNFWNGKTMYIRASDLAGKTAIINILPLPKGFPLYLQKEQREQLTNAEKGYLCSIDSIHMVHRVRKEIR